MKKFNKTSTNVKNQTFLSLSLSIYIYFNIWHISNIMMIKITNDHGREEVCTSKLTKSVLKLINLFLDYIQDSIN
jgi:hypothetical protein